MPDLPPAHVLRRGPLEGAPHGVVVLRHDERVLRRRRLSTARGEGFLADLPAAVAVEQGDAFELADGRLIAVVAAEEPLLEVRGPDLPRLAWHLGNRHAPCRIERDRLLVLRDPVLADMLRRLGATLRELRGPFMPEGGAYGPGSAAGHDHPLSRLAGGHGG